MEIKNLIEVSISEEHYKNLEEIKSCFEHSEEFDIRANYMRKSIGDLPMQIIINLQNIPLKDFVNWGVEGFVGGAAALAGKDTYSLLKSGIKKIYQKFKDCSLTIVCGERWYQLSENGKIKLTHPFDKSSEFGEKTIDEFFANFVLEKNNSKKSEWIECKIADIARSNLITLDKNYPHKEILYLDTGSITRGKIEALQNVLLENAPSRAKRMVKDGDIIYSTVRPIQRHYGFIKNPAENLIVSTGFSVITTDKTKADPLFLYYLLTSNDLVEAFDIIAEASTSTYPSLKPSDIEDFKIFLPPLEEQKAIAEVLSSLDDKIDLLHRQNQTLEKLAESLFEEWISERELDGTISQLVKIQNGYAFKSSDFKEAGNYGVLKIKNISSGIVDINKTDFVIDSLKGDANERFLVRSGDTIIGMTGAEIGKLGLVPQTEKSLYLNQRVGLLRESTKGAKYLAYLHLKSDFGQDYIENAATGSAQPNISGEGIENCPFPLFGPDKIEEYSKTILPLYEKLVFNLGQIQSLEKTRDQLLPKLMSGEIKLISEDK